MLRSTYPLLLLLISFALLTSCSKDPCSQTLTLQPDGEFGKDAFLHEAFPDQNSGNAHDNLAIAWTYRAIGGDEGACRSLLEFDLSSIPANARIESATLSLYHSIGTGNAHGGHSQASGSNDGSIYLVTSSWIEDQVTWNTHPTYDSNRSIYLPQSRSQKEDYLDIDLVEFVESWHSIPSSNHGMLIKLNTEQIYRGLVFGSSDQPHPEARPKLVVTYTVK